MKSRTTLDKTLFISISDDQAFEAVEYPDRLEDVSEGAPEKFIVIIIGRQRILEIIDQHGSKLTRSTLDRNEHAKDPHAFLRLMRQILWVNWPIEDIFVIDRDEYEKDLRKAESRLQENNGWDIQSKALLQVHWDD